MNRMDLETFNACMHRLDALSQMADVPPHRRAELMRLASDLRLAYVGITPEHGRQLHARGVALNAEKARATPKE
jgi:hypothetical protein